MKQDEIIDKDEVLKMAKQAGAIPIHKNYSQRALVGNENIEAFAKLVAEKAVEREREACAKVCDESAAYQKKYLNTHAQGVANGCSISIRARGETTLRGETT